MTTIEEKLEYLVLTGHLKIDTPWTINWKTAWVTSYGRAGSTLSWKDFDNNPWPRHYCFPILPAIDGPGIHTMYAAKTATTAPAVLAANNLANNTLPVFKNGLIINNKTVTFPNGSSVSLKYELVCSHSWKHYEGIMDSFDFCEKCDEKKR